MGLEEDIALLEKEMATTKYHKGTEHHFALMKARLARMKALLAGRKRAGGGKGFSVRKHGDATVVMVGLPSVGKSTILNKLTSAQSRVAEWEFTTKEVIPGMLEYEGANIQLLDIPGIIGGAASGKGRGKEVIGVVRTADLLLFVVDEGRVNMLYEILDELESAGVRIDKKPPEIIIKKKTSGGLSISGRPQMSDQMARAIAKEFGLLNADIIFRDKTTADQFIDFLSGNCVYIPSIVVLNKIDSIPGQKVEEIISSMKSSVQKDIIPISAEKGTNLEFLKYGIYKKLNLIRVFPMRGARGKGMDEDTKREPMILKEGATISDVCEKIHKDLRRNFKYALVWGKSVRFGGQRVGLTHRVSDGDIITIVAK
ncbi:MAG: GTP-binding protein [Candidatus Micrarchaeia archaeon]